MNLTWEANLEKDIDLYRIYKSLNDNFNPDTISTYFTSINPYFLDMNVSVGENYFYRISAVDIHENESEYSAISSIVVTSSVMDSQNPSEFELNQNYPNPFNPTTTITFSVPEFSEITIRIFNLLGQELVILTNKKYSPGTYNLQFNADNLTSGIYLYSINAISQSGKQFAKTRKIILLK